jgi:hypothetical protein
VNLGLGDHRQSLQQRGGRGTEVRLGIAVILVRLAVVGGQDDDAHKGRGLTETNHFNLR